MSLNIKNERVHAMARDASRRTGKSQTGVIEEALSRLLDELDNVEALQRRRERARAIVDDFHSRLTPEERKQATTDFLYDERGLPA